MVLTSLMVGGIVGAFLMFAWLLFEDLARVWWRRRGQRDVQVRRRRGPRDEERQEEKQSRRRPLTTRSQVYHLRRLGREHRKAAGSMGDFQQALFIHLLERELKKDEADLRRN